MEPSYMILSIIYVFHISWYVILTSQMVEMIRGPTTANVNKHQNGDQLKFQSEAINIYEFTPKR